MTILDVALKAILLADISSSSKLFQKLGDANAAALMERTISKMTALAEIHGGTFVHSRGDDVLCVFDESIAAFQCAEAVLRENKSGNLPVHAGLHWGEIVCSGGEIYGDAVNLTARLAASSNSGEILMSAAFADQLSVHDRLSLRPMDQMALKGMRRPVQVYAFLLPDALPSTHVTPVSCLGPAQFPTTSLCLSWGGMTHTIAEGSDVLIGRSDECQIALDDPWVSRKHASFVVRPGVVEYADRSSTGSYIRLGDGEEFFLRRQTTLLSGTGSISPGKPAGDKDARSLSFAVEGARSKVIT